MQKTIKTWKTTREPIEIVVDLPVYRLLDCGGDDYEALIWSRFNADGTRLNMRFRHDYGGKTAWEFEMGKWSDEELARAVDPTNMDSTAVTADEFEKVLARAMFFVSKSTGVAAPTSA